MTEPVKKAAELESLYSVEDGWFVLDRVVFEDAQFYYRENHAESGPGCLLEWNNRLDDRAKLVIRPESPALYVRVETDLQEAVLSESVSTLPQLESSPLAEVEALCQESENPDEGRADTGNRWLYKKRDEGFYSIGLDVPGGFYESELFFEKERIVLFVDLVNPDEYEPEGKEALELLLLRVNGLIKRVRSVVQDRQGQKKAGFQVVLGSACLQKLPHALSALSLACRLCDQELRVLRNRRVGKNYIRWKQGIQEES